VVFGEGGAKTSLVGLKIGGGNRPGGWGQTKNTEEMYSTEPKGKPQGSNGNNWKKKKPPFEKNKHPRFFGGFQATWKFTGVTGGGEKEKKESLGANQRTNKGNATFPGWGLPKKAPRPPGGRGGPKKPKSFCPTQHPVPWGVGKNPAKTTKVKKPQTVTVKTGEPTRGGVCPKGNKKKALKNRIGATLPFGGGVNWWGCPGVC